MTTPVAMATNRSYSKTKLAAANIVTSHIFSLHQLPLWGVYTIQHSSSWLEVLW